MEPLFISVVVCTYNRVVFLKKCLQSLYEQKYSNYEVIVVDGPSTDDTDQFLATCNDMTIIKQEELNGLSYARNLGISAAKGEIVAFIDDDAIADKYWLKFLADKYYDEKVGAVGGIVFSPGKTEIQFANGIIKKFGIPDAVRNENNMLKDDEIPILMGTNCSFRKSVLHMVGGFDPYFKYYHDESELCTRIFQAGYKIIYQKDAYVIHEMVEGHNRGSKFDLNWTEILKNIIYFTLKNFGGEFSSYTTRPIRAISWWFSIIKKEYFNKTISFKMLLKIYLKMIKGVIKGYIDGLRFNFNKKQKQASFLSLIDQQKEASMRQDPGSFKPEPNKHHLKIALLSQEYSADCKGGICRYTYDLAYGLQKLGHEVHVISKSDDSREHNYIDKNIHIHQIIPAEIVILEDPLLNGISNKNLLHSYAACIKLLDIIKTYNIQIVEAPLWDAEGFVFSVVCDIPLVVRIETPLFKVAKIQGWNITKDLKLANWMEGETVRRADKVIAISEGIGNLIANHHGIKWDKISLCPLGIAFPKDVYRPNEKQKETFEILFVGRLEKRKGIETLIGCISDVIDYIPEARLTVVGSDTDTSPIGSYKKHLLEMLDSKYHQYVDFVGFVPDKELEQYYRECDVFVAPSLYESFGLIYLEAMAYGKPVIGCDVGGVPEIIDNDENGLLIPPGDKKALFEAILKLNDINVRKLMGEKGREKVKNYYSIEKMTENTIEIYKSVLNS